MKHLNLNIFFNYAAITLFLLFQSNIISQSVLDSIVVTGEKYKSLDEQIREEARNDIANGKVVLFSHGWPVLNIDEAELLKLTHKYGFEYEKRGDVSSAIDRIYQDEVMIYLNKRNCEGWFEKFQEEAEKLIEYPTLPQKNKVYYYKVCITSTSTRSLFSLISQRFNRIKVGGFVCWISAEDKSDN